MMLNVIEQEIQKIQAEMVALAAMRDRLVEMLKASQNGTVVAPKKRSYTRKKKVGLPEAKEVA
jgi:hypothetical protein